LEGGGINGAFLAAQLIDAISLLLIPVADGAEGTPTLFDRIAGSARTLKLRSVTRLEDDILHLRYQLTWCPCFAIHPVCSTSNTRATVFLNAAEWLSRQCTLSRIERVGLCRERGEAHTKLYGRGRGPSRRML